MSKDNNKKWRNAGLYVLLAIVVVALGTAFLDQQPQTSQSWPYSRLIDEVQNNRIETVKISGATSDQIPRLVIVYLDIV